jgi:cell wall-associated NlpC family hydrolase
LRDPHATVRQRILNAAERLIGTPYIPGGESPDGVDCSGLGAVRLSTGRDSDTAHAPMEQFQAGQSPTMRVLPGDLLFFRTDASGQYFACRHLCRPGPDDPCLIGQRRQVRKVSLNQRYWRQRMVGGVTLLGRENPAASRRQWLADGPNG